MSVNALIAQGVRPIGSDLPEIANMLQQHQQQQLQNNRLATQDQYAAQQHDQQTTEFDQGQKALQAKQTYAEYEHLKGVPDDQLGEAIKSFPHIVEAAQKAKLTPYDTQALRAMVEHAGQGAAAFLGQGPSKQFKTIGDVNDPNAPLLQQNPDTNQLTSIRAGRDPLEQAKFDESVRHNKKEEGIASSKVAAAAPTGGGLDPDTIHDAAIDVMADKDRMRQYATFGQSGQAMRVAINNEKTKILHSIGMTEPQLIRQQAIAKGQIKSTSDLVGMQNAVNAYETLAQGNGQRVIELANSVNTSGVPLLNSAERLGKLASGSPDAAELMLVLHNYQVEAARIVTQPSLKGQLTDQAIKDLKDVVPANMTPKQAVRLVNRLNFEFDLRQRGIQGSLDTAGGQITPGFPTGAKPASGTTPTASSGWKVTKLP